MAEESSERRSAVRVVVRDLQLACDDLDAAIDIKDISANGVGFFSHGACFEPGQEIAMTVFIYGNPVLTEVKARVVRHHQGVVGAMFTDLSREQEDTLLEIIFANRE
jgi:hypothetical protein